MRRTLTVLPLCIGILLLFTSSTLHGQVPQDLTIRVSAGGLAPWSSISSITIDSLGNGRYVSFIADDPPALLGDTLFILSPSARLQIWQSVVAENFTAIVEPAPDTTLGDGGFLRIAVRANGAAHQVVVRNAPQAAMQAILTVINGVVPSRVQVQYTPPTIREPLSIDPCPPGFLRKDLPDGSAASPGSKKWGASSPARSLLLGGTPDAPHPGTVVSYAQDLEKAIRSGKVKLKSKGIFDGDAVSITGDNTHPQPTKSIDIRLYLDFWGPLATRANVLSIMADIIKTWDGLQTSGGAKVNMIIVPRLSPNATAPPGTPGYHQVELVEKGSVRSHCGDGPGVMYGPNFGTSDCQWEIGRDAGSYGHEAGHLMGLNDQYDNYTRQPDGSWSSPTTNTTFANDNAFTQYIVGKNPDLSPQDVDAYLKAGGVYSIPKPGHENDLMGKRSKKPLQSDIDKITGNPGMLITIRPGDVLLSRDTEAQNILMTHFVDLYVPPGKKRTLNGLYGCCIDGAKSAPDTTTVFDLAPPVSAWTGYPDAMRLDVLARYIDSTGQFCGDAFTPQSAIWRLTDNEPSSPAVDALLLSLGIHPGDQIIRIPHLTSSTPTDTNAQFIVPDELFAAHIVPQAADGTIGAKATFRGSMSAPASGGFTTSSAWQVTAPDGSHPLTGGAADSISFTPTRTGIYEIGMDITVHDSVQGIRTFPATDRGYLVVPNGRTETFEHDQLTDAFPWSTSGDAAWKISTTRSHTGSRSVEGGGMTGTNSTPLRSTLEIHITVPADTVITGFARWVMPSFADHVEFRVDTVPSGFFLASSEWKILRQPIKAGAHTLRWTVVQYSSTPGRIWLDNIVFPASAVLNSVSETPAQTPRSYELDQNYPNPFNPTTTIRYGLPVRSRVYLTIYDVLGQQVAVLQNGDQEAGYHTVQFNAAGLASGVYFCRIQASDAASTGARTFTRSTKLLLVR